MSWYDGDYLSYQNWGFGEPDVTLGMYPGGTCGYKEYGSFVPTWSTSRCGSKRGFICQKQKGNQCPDGWTFYASPDGQKCYKFMLNGATHKDYISAEYYCHSIGANIMEIANKGRLIKF